MVFLGHPQPPAAHDRRRQDHQAPLGWHPALARHQIANGILEGINSLVQAAKAKARGYRSTRNLKAIIYLIAGKLELRLPT